ncbi:MAG: hypothetical protein PUE15_10800 [Prevotella sp.]|nr:hypothetical protein [Prevotella sp.]
MKVTATTPTAPQVRATDVAKSFGKCLTLCLVYVLQRMAQAFGMAQRAALRACQWLNSRHNFSDKEDPVIMTGWQYLGFGVLVMVVVMVLSIKW